MPYFGRLLSETGVAFGSPGVQPSPATEPPSPDAAVPDALEVDDVVDVSQPVMRKATEMPDISNLQAGASLAFSPPPSPAELHPSMPEERKPGATPRQPSLADYRTEEANAAVPPRQEAAIETYAIERTPEERILETIAAVRAWTSMPATLLDPVAALEQESATDLAGGMEPPFRTIGPTTPRLDAPPPEPRLPMMPRRPASPDIDIEEPEVATVNLSIGSIELVIDASEGPAPASNREPPPLQHVAEADAAGRLRRHYFQEPIRW